MGMKPFAAPVDDILHSLREVADAGRLPHWDSETCEALLRHFAGFAESEIAPLNAVGDAAGCQLDGGRVTMPPGFRDVFARLAADGWQGLSLPENLGGAGVDPVTAAAVSEVFSGACHALQMVCNLVPGAAAVLLRYGTGQQQAHWLPRLARGEVLATMCLTEPDAGSDLSRIRCRGVNGPDGWRITGEKTFISGGDQDLSDGVLHLVLARTGAGGVKGLSLFLVPADDDRNGVTVERIEAKLGLHASPTCHLLFNGSQAELVGDEGAGLAVMFAVMNHARLDVALQGVAHAARAHDMARAYAAERVQGRRADGSDARLADHADVRRMLDEQRDLALGARGMVHVTLVELELAQRPDLVDFLTPVCKVFCSEAGIRAADLGLQIMGGYGYLNDYGMHQIWRDARITAIYEGANGIHARAHVTRGLTGTGAEAFPALIKELSPTDPAGLDEWQAMRGRLRGMADPLEHAAAMMALTGRVFFQAVLTRHGSRQMS
jgi:alkylation response protein AidB-like acyl-CoA dehydrogenase